MAKSKEETYELMMNYICPQCFNTLDVCECDSKPYYSLWWIDRNIQEVVRVLNEKGYKTQYCCESHDPQHTIYIAFMNSCRLDNAILAPEGFKFRSSRSVIEHAYGKDSKARKKMTMEEFEAEKKKHLDILLEWAKSLPEQPKEKNIFGW